MVQFADARQDGGAKGLRFMRALRIYRWLGLSFTLSILAAACASQVPRSQQTEATHAVARPKANPVEPGSPRTYGNVPVPFQLVGKEMYLVQAKNDAALLELNADAHLQPGSLAKLMTFYIALNALSNKKVSLTSKVTVGKDAAALARDGTLSRMFLRLGQQVTLEDLLYGMMVHSGCDAALAIADYLGGNAGNFVVQMNSEAERLGMVNTHFTHPSGLPEPGEYSCARDMATLALAVIREHPDATTYTSRQSFSFNGHNQVSTNELLARDPRVLGLKSGHVQEAGYHLVAFARSDQGEFVSVVMGEPSEDQRTMQSEVLLWWAYENYPTGSPIWRTGSSADANSIRPAS